MFELIASVLGNRNKTDWYADYFVCVFVEQLVKQ